MSLASRIRDFVLGKPVKPKGVVASGERKDLWSTYFAEAKRKSISDLKKLVFNDSLVFSALHLFSSSCLGKGWEVVGSNKKAVELADSVMKLTSFKPAFLTAIFHSLAYGIGYMENIWQNKTIVGFNSLDPETVQAFWDQHGTPTSFKQVINSEVKATFEPHEITYFKFFPYSSEWRGMGFVEPLYDLIVGKKDMENSIRELYRKFAYPQVHITRDDAKSREDLIEVEEMFKDFDRKSFFATGPTLHMDLLELKRTIPDLSKLSDHFIDLICCGLRVPRQFLFGTTERTPRASAYAIMMYSNFEIQLIQEKLTQIVESQIFKPLCEKNNLFPIPDLVWKPIPLAEEDKVAKILSAKVDMLLKLHEKGILTAEEVRKNLKNGVQL